MVVYFWVAAYALRRYSAYPAAAAAEAVSNTVFGFFRSYILIALWTVRPHLGGYDVGDAVTFCFLTQALIGPVQIFGGIELTERIRTGAVAVDLHRPVDLQGWWLADDLGRALATLVLRGVLPLAAGAFAFGLHTPGAAGWAAFPPAVLLAIMVGFGLRYLFALSVFWLHDDRGVMAIALVLAMFMSGMIVPLVAFPGGLGEVARALPWAAMIQVPADVFIGRHDGWRELAGALGFQAFWAAVLLGAGQLVTRLARRRLVVHGG